MPGRGIDFEHKFRTSRWAEDLLIQSLGPKHNLLTRRFGLSEVRPNNTLHYDANAYKEPDLLIYQLSGLTASEGELLERIQLTSASRERFSANGNLRFAIEKAMVAVEVEFSPYKAREMKGRHWRPKTTDAWNRRPLKLFIASFAYADDWGRGSLYDPQFALEHVQSLTHLAGRGISLWISNGTLTPGGKNYEGP